MTQFTTRTPGFRLIWFAVFALALIMCAAACDSGSDHEPEIQRAGFLPSLTLEPAEVEGSQPVNVVGVGFNPNAGISLHLSGFTSDSSSSGPFIRPLPTGVEVDVPTTAKSDEDGSFTTVVALPAGISPGMYRVSVIPGGKAAPEASSAKLVVLP